MVRGSPHFMEGLKERRQELLRRLKESPPENLDRVVALFAFDYSLRIEKVMEYYDLLQRAGLLD